VSSRLALGTVQFGLPYGIANRTGQVDPGVAAAILEFARGSGLDTLDTAIAYGESEQRLGEIGVSPWRIISKLPPVPDAYMDVSTWARQMVLGSLSRLGVGRLHGLLLHRAPDLLGPFGGELRDTMVSIKDEGLVENIGVSIYSPEELEAIHSCMPLDVVQAPFNVFDRRLETSGWLERLKRAGTKIHVRSVFLQGLLLMDAAVRPAKFRRWQALWDRWDAWLLRTGLTPLQACMGFVLSYPQVDRVVVGVDSVRHLLEIVDSVSGPGVDAPADLIGEDLDLLNPSRWSAS